MCGICLCKKVGGALLWGTSDRYSQSARTRPRRPQAKLRTPTECTGQDSRTARQTPSPHSPLPPPPAHQTSPARSWHFPNCPKRTLSPATKVSAEERGGRRKTYQGRQELLIKGHLGLTHCLNRGPNGGNIAANCCELGDGGFIILEVGRSQSFLPLRRGLFAGITARENTKLGRSPNDSAPKGLSAEDRDRLSQLALGVKQLAASRDQTGRDLNQISTRVNTE